MDTKKAAAPDTKAEETGREETGPEETKAAAPGDAVQGDADHRPDNTDADAATDDDAGHGDDSAGARTGIGAGAAAVAGAGLGVASLTGTWVGRVAAERQTLIGQLETPQGADPGQTISALYGAAWDMTALVNGAFAVLALLVGVFVLVRPAFGTPRRTQPVWVRSFAWAAVALGALGLLIAGVMYSGALVGLPQAGS
ncbi:hypothetical protein [Streptomyces sp. SYSU K217416]